MFFSKIDSKNNCKSIYADNKVFSDYKEDMKFTWTYQENLPANVKFVKLFCKGKGLVELLSNEEKQDYNVLQDKIKNTLKSYSFCGYDPREYCLDELIGKSFIKDFFTLKNKAMSLIIKKYPEPKNYDQLEKIERLAHAISKKKLNLNLANVYTAANDNRIKKIIKRYSNSLAFIHYNTFGTITGRLSTTPSSFPILTLNKEYRTMVTPNNDTFVEFDYNAFELRVFAALLGRQQPEGDIHDWNIKNLFKDGINRSDAKKRIFAWLYNPNSDDAILSHEYDRKSLLKKYFSNGKVITDFDREIEADDYHALNYLIQSTASDLFLEQVYKVFKILEDNNAQSYISMLIHDSMVLDFDKKDHQLLDQIKNTFKNTRYGDFKLNIQIGKTLGDLGTQWK
mgnify:CR=1 FL=1|tara:strand:+ start:2915 stop:4102 length:1188 start_codon:yes stop_codon:yes gene_type:complete